MNTDYDVIIIGAGFAGVTAARDLQNWVNHEFALSTWCSYRPTQVTRLLAGVQKREGNVFFAGSDVANGWRGFFDGAVESGIRVANQVAREL